LGIRAIIEESILRLLADATGVPYSVCMQENWDYTKKQEVDVNKPLPSDSSVGKPAAEQNIDSNKAIQNDPSVEKPVEKPTTEGPSLTPNEEIKELVDKYKHPSKGGIAK
jgi:hypothetical protein